jgi:hypothetical protein
VVLIEVGRNAVHPAIHLGLVAPLEQAIHVGGFDIAKAERHKNDSEASDERKS